MDEHAVVLKYLELRASRQGDELAQLTRQGAALAGAVSHERAQGDELMALLGLEGRGAPGSAGRPAPALQPAGVGWAALRDEAALALKAEGIEASGVRLPASEHRLDAADVAAALAFGALGALTPSLGSRRGLVGDAFAEVQRAADTECLPGLLQSVFGRHPAPFMDAGASGIYHRFCDGHDLISALPVGVSTLGWVRGPLQVFQHLLTDSFGATGIPLPGSDLVGSSVARVAGVSSIKDLISPRDLSRYASLRMSDGVASGVTSLLLWIYTKVRGIPEGSMRRPKLGVLAHGLCLVGVAACAATPALMHLVPFRSHINYVSLAAVAKNAWAWRGLTTKLTADNNADFERIRIGCAELEACRAEASLDAIHRELEFAANVIASA